MTLLPSLIVKLAVTFRSFFQQVGGFVSLAKRCVRLQLFDNCCSAHRVRPEQQSRDDESYVAFLLQLYRDAAEVEGQLQLDPHRHPARVRCQPNEQPPFPRLQNPANPAGHPNAARVRPPASVSGRRGRNRRGRERLPAKNALRKTPPNPPLKEIRVGAWNGPCATMAGISLN